MSCGDDVFGWKSLQGGQVSSAEPGNKFVKVRLSFDIDGFYVSIFLGSVWASTRGCLKHCEV